MVNWVMFSFREVVESILSGNLFIGEDKDKASVFCSV